eukprot:GHRR01012358.1.p1 GENE.GHRR01012358.1~~GHRR01012358.1.p1  ORF type:complete len:176 (-),score=97.84 GHRR01012358.1:810-1337(-)
MCLLQCPCLPAGGDDMAASVLPHQLQELVVLAGLDPAAPQVMKLLDQLHQHCSQTAGDRRLCLDAFLHVVCHFRNKPLAVLQTEQQQLAAAPAAAVAQAAQAAEITAPQAKQLQLQEDEQQVLQHSMEEASADMQADAEDSMQHLQDEQGGEAWREAQENDELREAGNDCEDQRA